MKENVRDFVCEREEGDLKPLEGRGSFGRKGCWDRVGWPPSFLMHLPELIADTALPTARLRAAGFFKSRKEGTWNCVSASVPCSSCCVPPHFVYIPCASGEGQICLVNSKGRP